MQNIEKNIADNIGGIYTFYFIPVADVVSIPLAVSKQISDAVVLAALKYFYSAEITLESFSYKEPQTDSDDGSSYAVSLGGFVAGDSPQLTDLFDEMSGGRFIVICEDSNNKKRLLGTIANGMRFKADFDTNNKTAGLKGWNILFSGLMSERPPFYQSTFSAYSTNAALPVNDIDYLQGEIVLLQSAVAGKEAAIAAGSSAQYWRGDKTWQTLNTSVVPEGTNLYYTQARFDSAFTAKSTSNLSEGTNLYYTQARFDSAFTAKSTSNLSEGTNLYYTNARAIAATLTGYASGSGTISATDTLLGAIQKLNGNDALKVSTGSAGSLLSLALTGTAGAGYLQLLSQSSPPSAVSGNMILYSNSSNSFSLVKRNAANSADITRVFTFPDSSVSYAYPAGSDTLAGIGTAQQFSAAQAFTVAVQLQAGITNIGGNGSTSIGSASACFNNIFARNMQADTTTGTDTVGQNFTIKAGNGTGGGVQNTSESSSIILQAPQILATGLTTVQTSTKLAEFGWWNSGTTGSPTNIAGMWMGNVTPSATNYTLLRSTDLFINSPGQYYFRSGSADKVWLSTGGQGGLLVGSGSLSLVYRLTNGGSNVSAQFMVDTVGAVSISGGQSLAYDTSNGLLLLHSNGTLRVRGWSAKLTNLVNTAGSESADITWTPQNTTDNFIVSGGLKATGFGLGVTPVSAQIGAAQTASLTTYGATEADMLQKAYNALRTFGFLG